MAMSQDNLLPSFFGRVNKKYNTPINAILFTSIFMIAVIFLPLEMLVKTASTMMLLLYIFVNVAVIIMRESGIQNYRPKFKSPLYPWLQVIAVLVYLFLIIEMGSVPFIMTAVFIISGLVWYWFYGSIRSNKESALLQLVKRIKAKDLITTSLDTELKEIIRERDDIRKDRFDKLIETAVILDVNKSVLKEDFFKMIADKVCVNIDKSSEYFLNKLIEREEESSTALTDTLAIPHIIIEGEKKFNILLARCLNGIYFNEEAQKVNTVFVITGTRDERNFHLQALAAIAQIVQDSSFEKKWLKAKNKEALRDIVLLGERRRKK